MKVNEPKGKRRVMAEINMVPMIDVMLVLMIIFMVMTPLMVRTQIKITLPKSQSADKVPNKQQTVKVQVQKDGVIFINGEPVSKEAIDSVLKRLVHDPENQPVVIEADKEVPFQHVVIVMDAAKRLGVVKLGVSVKLEEGEKGAAAK